MLPKCTRNIPEFFFVGCADTLNYVSLRINENWNRLLFLRSCNTCRMQVDHTSRLHVHVYLHMSLAFCELRINSVSMLNSVSIFGCLSCMRSSIGPFCAFKSVKVSSLISHQLGYYGANSSTFRIFRTFHLTLQWTPLIMDTFGESKCPH